MVVVLAERPFLMAASALQANLTSTRAVVGIKGEHHAALRTSLDADGEVVPRYPPIAWPGGLRASLKQRLGI